MKSGGHSLGAEVESSPSRVVENIGTVGERRAFWKEKDEEEVIKRASIHSCEGLDNTGFIGAESIDGDKKGPKRVQSPYEIDRMKEAIFLDTDEEECREIKLEEVVEQAASLSPSRKVAFKMSQNEEVDQAHDRALQDIPDEIRDAATHLVQDIESKLEERLGIQMKVSEPSSVDVTDEEFVSPRESSSPDQGRGAKTDSRSALLTRGATDASTPEAQVKSSSSGEFFTAQEHSEAGLRSSSDDPTRPKSWDSSLLGQVSNNFPTSGSGASEYQTALSAVSGASTESYIGTLSSDVSASETLVASQIDLGRELGDYEEDVRYEYHPRTSVEYTTSNVGARSVTCEAKTEGDQGSGLPVTLTSSTAGTTVCTQVETTYEAQVKGDPELQDDQDGNTFLLDSSGCSFDAPSPVKSQQSNGSRSGKTHRRSDSLSWSDSLLYGIEEKIEDDVVYPVEEEISELFIKQDSQDDTAEPVERPTTPEPGFAVDDANHKITYFQGTSLDSDDIVEEFSCGLSPQDYVLYPQKLEDIEEEGSLKNSPKSVQSFELTNGNNSVEKCRPGSRESSASLHEFERLESAVLEEETAKKELSEIEEGHESQISEASDETEMYGGEEAAEPDQQTLEEMLEDDVKNLTSSESSSSHKKPDPIMFFCATVQSLEEACDSSLEFQIPESNPAAMTSSADSLGDKVCPEMNISKDSLDLEASTVNVVEANGSSGRQVMTDSLTGGKFALTISDISNGMSDSLEMKKKAGSSETTMIKSSDSLQERQDIIPCQSTSEPTEMATSIDSIEGAYAASSTTSTTGDAAVCSSVAGSESTLMSSQEDLTLEN